MDTQHYQPITTLSAPIQTCTWGKWCAGGTQRSDDGYQTYEIGVFQHWYVYRRKPKWFGTYDGDRYLGKLRWISQHCDGTQWRNVTRYGQLNGTVVNAGSQDASSKIAGQLQHAYGYLQQYHFPDLRERRKARDYYKQVRCAVCGITNAEVERKRQTMAWDLAWPKSTFSRGMDSYDARQIARRTIACNCGK